MSIKPLGTLLCSLLFLGGCAEFEALISGTAQSGGSSAQQNASPVSDALFINPEAQAAAVSLRNVYIAPANLANMQVIQPEGASADAEWWVTDEENSILQNVITFEFSVALGYKTAFNIVHNRAQADIVVNTAVVAVHPDEARASVARGGKPGGAITVSIVLVKASNDQVLVRLVDTRSVDDIWAFNLMKKDDPALNLIFRAWGENIRDGLLQSQGRPDQ